MPTHQARWNGVVSAESEHTIRLEGKQYFPPESLNRNYFTKSPTTSRCPWNFDPLLVVIAPFALLRLRRAASTWRMVLAGSGIGASLAFAATLLLDGAGALRGPALLGSIGPVPEALIAIALGIAAVVGAHTVIRQTRSVR